MKSHLLAAMVAALVMPSVLPAADAGEPELIRRGDAILTLTDMDARMHRFPAHERANYARDPQNLARLMDALLLTKQLAREAVDIGVDQDPLVQRDMELARLEILASHRVNRLVDPDQLPDFGPLARERYMANPAEFTTPEQFAVRHVLFSTQSRTPAEALALANEALATLRNGTGTFDDLVREQSDDPGKAENDGRYTVAAPGSYVPEFEAAARALQAPGDLSPPVLTEHGYHIIQLESRTPQRLRSFDEVRADLERNLRDEYLESHRTNYVRKFRAEQEVGNEALLLTLPARYGGRPELREPPAQSPARPSGG